MITGEEHAEQDETDQQTQRLPPPPEAIEELELEPETDVVCFVVKENTHVIMLVNRTMDEEVEDDADRISLTITNPNAFMEVMEQLEEEAETEYDKLTLPSSMKT